MNFWILVLIVILFLTVYIFYQITVQASMVKALMPLNKLKTIGADTLKTPTSSKYYYEAWVYVTSPTSVATMPTGDASGGMLFGRDVSGNKDICLGILHTTTTPKNVLYFYTRTDNDNTVNTIITEEFPLNKWVYIVMNVNKDLVEVYLNGKLVKTTQMAKSVNPDATTAITMKGVTSGYITRFIRKPENLDTTAVWNNYLKGNGQYGGMLFGLLDYFAAYNLKIDVSKNSKVIRELNLGANFYPDA